MDFTETDKIQLLINGISNIAIRSNALTLKITNKFLEKMHRITNNCGSNQKKSSLPSVRKDKLKEPTIANIQLKDNKKIFCKARGRLKVDCFKLKKNE